MTEILLRALRSENKHLHKSVTQNETCIDGLMQEWMRIAGENQCLRAQLHALRAELDYVRAQLRHADAAGAVR